jgi:hypothetical protein
MFGSQYYHQSIRKYITVFGTLFNDITVQRIATDGTVTQTIAVPIAYGPKEKWLSRLRNDPDLNKPTAIQLPRMSFEMQTFERDSKRNLTKLKKNAHILTTTDGDTVKSQFTPVGYDINMSLFIFIKNADDGAQIVEQILPYFRPEWTVPIRLIPEMSLTYDVPIVLTSTNLEDAYEGGYEERRALVWTLDFQIKGWLFGPVQKSGVIKRSFINQHLVTESGSTIASQIGTLEKERQNRVQPGQFANGSPTTNSTASIAISGINANDVFGFAKDIYDDPNFASDSP